MDMKRGFRDKLEKYLNLQDSFEVEMSVQGKAVYDYCCFGVDDEDKLSDDRYMIFYNQPFSPKREISYNRINNSAIFTVKLTSLPTSIERIVFTVSIDGNSDMSKIKSHQLSVVQNGRTVLNFKLSGSDFQRESSLISAEIYKKGEWRFAAIGSGFNGGLGDLLRNYGGEEEAEEQPAQTSTSNATRPQPSPSPSQNSKPQAPKPQPTSVPRAFTPAAGASRPTTNARPINDAMLNGAVQNLKKVLPSLNLAQCRARIVLVIEASQQTAQYFSNGSMQNLITKVLPLAMQFSDNAQLEYWLYGSRPKKMFPIGERNYASAIPNDWGSLMWSLGENKSETTAMTEVLSSCQPFNMPSYILFITSGNIPLNSQIEQMVVSSSQFPVFWQFLGMGNSRYGVFENITNLPGSTVCNAKFAAISGFSQNSTPELYKFLLSDFSKWRKEATKMGLIS